MQKEADSMQEENYDKRIVTSRCNFVLGSTGMCSDDDLFWLFCSGHVGKIAI